MTTTVTQTTLNDIKRHVNDIKRPINDTRFSAITPFLS